VEETKKAWKKKGGFAFVVVVVVVVFFFGAACLGVLDIESFHACFASSSSSSSSPRCSSSSGVRRNEHFSHFGLERKFFFSQFKELVAFVNEACCRVAKFVKEWVAACLVD